ncbi:MAG: hypothetical protein JKY65_01200 [Planctomycetes bacterium]|nr:hypothetical protein [Planctomycetota bacterium]
MGYDDDDHYDEPKKSNVLKIVLIVLGVFVALIVIAGAPCAVLMTPALTQATARANQTKCANNLRQIGLGAAQYADDKRYYVFDASGDMSQTITTLQRTGYISDAHLLNCPEVQSGPSYEGMAAPYSRNVSSAVATAWDAVPHTMSGLSYRNVLMADCTVQFMPEDEFQSLKERHDARAEKVRAAHKAKSR